MTELSAAETFRIFEEAREQRDRAERAEAEAAHWRLMAEQYQAERDAFRRTLGDLLGQHPARIVAPAERPAERPT